MNKTLETILASVPVTTTADATSPGANEFKKLVKSSLRAGSCVSNPEGHCAGSSYSCASNSGGDCGAGCGGCGGGGVGAGGSL